MFPSYISFVNNLNVLNVLNFNTNTRGQKVYKPRFDPMELDDKSFRQKYRFTNANMVKIINLVRSDLEGSNRGGHISVDFQVMAAIRYWGRNESGYGVCWRGSTHDSRIFRESTIKEMFERGEFRARLLGDGGYACSNILFTPLLNPRTHAEEQYNIAQIATRNTVERCFGVWKSRLRILLTGFRCSLENTKATVIALAVLHNLAIDFHDNTSDCDEDEDIPVEENLHTDNDYLPQNERTLIRSVHLSTF